MSEARQGDSGEEAARPAAPAEAVWHEGGLWQKPRLLRDWHQVNEEDNRKTSYQELFFDLIFVTAIANLGEALRGEDEEDARLPMIDYILVFVTVYFFWTSALAYATRFYNDDVSNKLWLATYMWGVVGMSAHAREHVKTDAFQGFCTAAALCTTTLSVGYARAGYHIPRARFVCYRAAVLDLIQTGIWLLAYVPGMNNRALLGVNLAYSFALPIVNVKLTAKKNLLPLHLDHFTERHGLFCIVTLGEAVSGLTVSPHRDPAIYAGILFAFTIVVEIKLLYFDCSIVPLDDHALRRSIPLGLLWSWTHPALLVAIAVMGSGLRVLLLRSDEDRDALNRGVWWTVCSYGVVMLVLATQRLVHAAPVNYVWLYHSQVVIQAVVGVACIFAPQVWGAELVANSSVPLLGTLCGVGLFLVAFNLLDEYLEHRDRDRGRKQPAGPDTPLIQGT